MSNLTDFFGKSQTRAAGGAAHSQPAFSVLTSRNSAVIGMLTYDHALNCIAQNSWISNATDYLTEMGSLNQPSSFQNTTNSSAYTDFGGRGMGANGFTGNAYWDLGNGNYASGNEAHMPPVQKQDNIGINTNVHGSSVGVKQHYVVATGIDLAGAAAYIRACPRSIREATMFAESSRGGAAYGSVSFSTVGLQSSGMMTTGNYKIASGGFSYNQQSGNAVIMERDNSSDSNPWRPVLIKNFPDPAKYVSDNVAWEAAITAVTATASNRVVGVNQDTTNISTRGASAMRHAKIILCDNNDVVMGNFTTNGYTFFRWRWNAGNNNWDTCERNSVGWTTVYSNNTQACDSNYVLSLDGKTACIFSHSYYYCTGFNMMVINTVNGNCSKLYQKTDGTYNYSICPLGANRFILAGGHNTDNQGVNNRIFSWESLDSDFGIDQFSLVTNGPPIEGGKFIDVAYTSTNYPLVIPHINIDNEAIVMAEKGEL